MKKKNIFKLLVALLFAFALMSVSCPGVQEEDDYICSDCNKANCTCAIFSPYRGVNWDTWGQYKASLHVHSSNSDGSSSLSTVVEQHYTQNFDILAITDHSETTNHLSKDYVNVNNGLTQTRFNEITAGAGRTSGKPMILIPDSSEQRMGTNTEEANAFFHPSSVFGGWVGDTYPVIMPRIQSDNGLAFVNHPGRATNGRNDAAQSSNPTWINLYANRFRTYPFLLGFEIMNRIDGDSRNDRILWDNVLKVLVPEGRYIWGYSNDDSHSSSEIGVNYNMFLMPSNTLEDFRTAMVNGSFYGVARVAHNEGVNGTTGGTRPSITGITVDQSARTITINAANADKIVWISEGKTVTTQTAFPATLNLNTTYDEAIGSYVRANIIGNGIVFTQPFIIKQ